MDQARTRRSGGLTRKTGAMPKSSRAEAIDMMTSPWVRRACGISPGKTAHGLLKQDALESTPFRHSHQRRGTARRRVWRKDGKGETGKTQRRKDRRSRMHDTCAIGGRLRQQDARRQAAGLAAWLERSLAIRVMHIAGKAKIGECAVRQHVSRREGFGSRGGKCWNLMGEGDEQKRQRAERAQGKSSNVPFLRHRFFPVPDGIVKAGQEKIQCGIARSHWKLKGSIKTFHRCHQASALWFVKASG